MGGGAGAVRFSQQKIPQQFSILQEKYITEADADLLTFDFISNGPKGDVKKVVRYTEMNVKDYFNLGFGDKDPITGFVSDLIITNNSDSQKVLATVAATLYAFFEEYPEANVIATGSTEARTRLYRMGITNNLVSIEQDFRVFGLTQNG